MKTFSNRYALLALVALALGVGLIAAAPAQANIVHTAVNQTFNAQTFSDTYSIVSIYLDPESVILPSPAYELKPYGVSAFRVDAINLSLYLIIPGLGEKKATGQASGLSNTMIGDPDTGVPARLNYPVGYYVPATVNLGDLDPENPTVDVEIPVIKKLNGGELIKYYPDYFLDHTDSTIRDLLGIDIGGFSAEVHLKNITITGVGTLPAQDLPATGAYGEFINSRGFAGFQFEDDGGGIHYGWLDLYLNYNASDKKITNMTIYDWAFENDAGRPIIAGEKFVSYVPLPASVLLLGSGLLGLGLLGWRRKS